jgi:hypothetical protein
MNGSEPPVTERPSVSAMEEYLGRVRAVVIAASDYLPPESVEDAVSMVEHGEPPEALIQLAWAIVAEGAHVPGWIIDAIYDLGASINDPDHLPLDLRNFAE